MRSKQWRTSIPLALLVLSLGAFGNSSGGQPVVDNPNQAAGVPASKLTEIIDLGGGVTMEFVLIRPGSFVMGSNSGQSDEKPAHKVSLTRPFHLGKYEVTQQQWERVMGHNPSDFKGTNLPVENVSWNDCQAFLTELSKKIGRKFALPTEAQWEYACRAGTTNLYSFGDDLTRLAEHAWYSDNSNFKTHAVGQKKPNPWGLYDMHGNVFEWCADSYSESYPGGAVTDPAGPLSGALRNIRGGAWLYVPDNLRSSDRGFSPPDYRINEYGLRCVMLGDQAASSHTVVRAQDTAAAEAKAKAASLLARLEPALTDRNKFQAENLFAQLESLTPDDPHLAALRYQVAALPWPEGELAIDLGDGVMMDFVLIRPGSFTMGSDQDPLSDQKPAHNVTITKPFYFGKYEVTQKQWETIMGRNLSLFKQSPRFPDGLKHPVENVSWLLCQSFLAKVTGKIKGYEFRLPTEAEWEYACRAGSTNDHSFGNSTAALGDYAWYGNNSDRHTHPVGEKKPNPWGLHDLYGNVWEWCQDWYGPYSSQALRDPAGSGNSSPGAGRVLRGGAWNNTPDHVLSTYRHAAEPTEILSYYGFRCVATPKFESAGN
ncbi:MAG: formylglycine-generating enzyme family protein [Akkermansiaceae bacterium]|nr:formylglycine-generating enzyme family protein [Verrucomicrobiales bacterium]